MPRRICRRHNKIESLESRRLLAAVSWDGGGNGTNWNDPNNWSNNQLPGANDDVTIDVAADPSIVINSADVSVKSLNCAEFLTLTNNRMLTLAATSSFTDEFDVTGGTLTLNGDTTLAYGFSHSWRSATVNGSASLIDNGLLVVRGGVTINTALSLPSGSSIHIEANNGFGNGLLTVANGFTNNGTIYLTSSSVGAFGATLAVSNGTFVNHGVLYCDGGVSGAGSRTLSAELDNFGGNVYVNYSLSIVKASAHHKNRGQLLITGGDLTVMQSGASPSFVNTYLINVDAGRKMTVTAGTVENAFFGVIEGNGTIAADVNNTEGTIKPGDSPGQLTIEGNYTQSNNGFLNIDVGGTTAGTNFDRLAITGIASLGGTITTVLSGGYLPPNGQTFDVITYASHVGDFTTKRYEVGNGIVFTSNAGASFQLTAHNNGPTFAVRTGDSLVIMGSAGPDDIRTGIVADNLQVTYSGFGESWFSQKEIKSILIKGLAGADYLLIGVGVSYGTIDGGPGTDTMTGDGYDDRFFARDGEIDTVTGGDGNDIAQTDANDIVTGVEHFLNSTIAGNVWNDSNSNGTKDGGESGIGAWVLYLDTNNNNTKDANELETTTDASGNYLFDGLIDAPYHVKQQLKSGYRKTLPGSGTPGYDVTAPLGQAGIQATGKNFGATTNILLAGTVYNDTNNNALRDAGEPGIPGVVINIVSNNQTVATRTTDVNGAWQVKGLSAGTGEADIVLPAGFICNNPAAGKYTGTMTSGQANAVLNFGLHKTGPAPAPSGTGTAIRVRRVDSVWNSLEIQGVGD